ncbi:MAG: hypothetical protein H6608_01655 [Flavobacteriales bacterium]|nr:hypothetical protein [Bacteroidota bacterium]MCB9239812.1 hypothetical protein [Flavobacteriales bacterium]
MKSIPFPYRTFWVVTLFAVAMAMLESAVVIYLRAMLYPDGFVFPLETLDLGLAVVEVSREAATILMLIGIGWLAGNNGNTRFAYFLHAFAVWDIFYYVFLYVFLGWPQSPATWDVLFLIPVMWVGPVWSPVLLSFMMIAFAVLLIRINASGYISVGRNWYLLITGALTCIAAFCWDPVQFMMNQSSGKWYQADHLFKAHYVPQDFPEWLFVLGIALLIAGVFRYHQQNRFSKNRMMLGQFI